MDPDGYTINLQYIQNLAHGDGQVDEEWPWVMWQHYSGEGGASYGVCTSSIIAGNYGDLMSMVVIKS